MNVIFCDDEKKYSDCHDFVLSYEKQSCALMEKILHKEKGVYFLQDKSCAIQGVFSYSELGHGILFCIPQFNFEIIESLKDFFKTKKIFCITGEAGGALELKKIIESIGKFSAKDVRDYFFMEHTGNFLTEKKHQIVLCSKKDLKALKELHFGYMKEEVLPLWEGLCKSAEVKNLEHILKSQNVFAISNGKCFVAKVQTNAVTENYFQIGGVYTHPFYRKQGMARELVSHIAEYGMSLGKKTVLFVKEKNIPALTAYQKAGFAVTGRNKIIYFLPNSTERL